MNNNKSFISNDPISIPKQFSRKQDIEISAFWVSMLSWGKRQTIINKSRALFDLMENNPYEFILNHKESDRKRFSDFKHRTFQYTDTLYFLEFFQWFYNRHESMEKIFSNTLSIELALCNFHELFFHLPHAPQRTRKHISTPAKNSSCKRLNMFLRWMVRQDDAGVDFGIWDKISPAKLMVPLDVHVQRVALTLNLLKRTQRDWKAVVELTENLKKYDSKDPIKYDFALFGLGVNGIL